MQNSPAPSPQRRLARLARQRFVEGMGAGMAELDKTVADFLGALIAQTGTAREMQSRRDTWMLYQQLHAKWVSATTHAWQEALAPHASARPGLTSSAGNNNNLSFELLSDDVVENKIVASRMALTVAEQAGAQFDALRQRTQSLEGQEIDSNDILRPETICLLLVQQWVDAGLPRTDLLIVVDPLQRELANVLQKQYQAVNAFYVEQGVAVPSDLRSRVKRTVGGATGGGGGMGGGDSGAGGLASQALAQSREAMAAGRQAAAGMYPQQMHPQHMQARMHQGQGYPMPLVA